MSTLSARLEDERLRLWGGSAFGVLLAHLAVAALLLQHFDWQRPVLVGDAMNVELDSLPGPAPSPTPQATSPLQSASRRPSLPPQILGRPLEPLPDVKPIPTAEPSALIPPASGSQPISSALPAAAVMPLSRANLTTAGASASAAPSAEQVWVAQLLPLLERYKQYPRRAVRRGEQDTVALQFAVDVYGRLLDVEVDSPRHYRDLEEEAKTMVRLAAPLPPPPPELRAERIVVHVPVEFYLTKPAPVADAARCVAPASPGEVPDGSAATLDQMRAYRQRLQEYVTAVRDYSACMQHSASPPVSSLSTQVNALVARFDSQSQLLQATATRRALLAQQAQAALLSKAEALAATAYAACTRPSGPERLLPAAGSTVRADQWLAYRKAVTAYDAAVRGYIACIDEGMRNTLAATGALSDVQRAQLARRASELQNAAVEPLNRVIQAFNGQLQALESRTRPSGERSNPAGALGSPVGTWSVPSPPLPANECVRIAYVAGSWHAALCRRTYTSFSEESAPGGIVIGADTQTYVYDVSALQVLGRRVSLTIRRTLQSAGFGARGDLAATPQRFQLTLSRDGQRLVGACAIDEILRPCQFVRQP